VCATDTPRCTSLSLMRCTLLARNKSASYAGACTLNTGELSGMQPVEQVKLLGIGMCANHPKQKGRLANGDLRQAREPRALCTGHAATVLNTSKIYIILQDKCRDGCICGQCSQQIEAISSKRLHGKVLISQHVVTIVVKIVCKRKSHTWHASRFVVTSGLGSKLLRRDRSKLPDHSNRALRAVMTRAVGK
jgi:hypothetical protein